MEANVIKKEEKGDSRKITCKTKKFLDVVSGIHECSPHCIQAIIAIAAIGTFLIVGFQIVVQSRAWVTIKKAYHEPFEAGKKAKVNIVFCNSGNSPALNVIVQAELELRDTEIPTPMPFREKSKSRSKSVIGPNVFPSATIYSQDPLTKQALDIIFSQKKRLYVWGRIEYDDIFKMHRITNFCMRREPGTKNFEACENNNTAK